ncbi:uncharacterized protein DUF222 [Haloactinopolyspora alba]|uniref:Uncharacterized protein DUF222 n=1 Tax=Haloactinopolyspora alba TaxID=648780 RepID=A0A2P8E7A3_9ACTN|nr:HNH endonuclease signature motif containing protein [Haloactinopolyspora alba]PSL05350.1 uncharacterized protein DUF222 [Haloactinopolyspora alba]
MNNAIRTELERALDTPPGPELAVWLSTLDLGELSTHDVVAVVAAWERQKAFTEARMTQALAEVVRRPEYQRCRCPIDADAGHMHRAVEPAGDEISLALTWSPGRARDRVATAAELCEELPATLTALEDGRIDDDKARLIVSRTRCLHDPDLRRRVEAAVLPVAVRGTRTQLDHALRREVIAADPEAAEDRCRRAGARRHVTRPEPVAPGGDDGMARLELVGPAEDVTALWNAVDAAARHTRRQGDSRGLEQLRFDLLTGLGWTGLDTGHLGCCNPACADAPEHRLSVQHRRAAAVHVTVGVTTLLGADDQPGELEGFGPITADVARRISTEGTWRRLLTEPTGGRLLDYGRTTYSPPADLADFVTTRDRTCRFPTCTRSARGSDIDHIRPYRHAGTTSAGNTWTLHRGHHIGRTHHGFELHTDEHGITSWKTPAGHHYAVDPEAVPGTVQWSE